MTPPGRDWEKSRQEMNMVQRDEPSNDFFYIGQAASVVNKSMDWSSLDDEVVLEEVAAQSGQATLNTQEVEAQHRALRQKKLQKQYGSRPGSTVSRGTSPLPTSDEEIAEILRANTLLSEGTQTNEPKHGYYREPPPPPRLTRPKTARGSRRHRSHSTEQLYDRHGAPYQSEREQLARQESGKSMQRAHSATNLTSDQQQQHHRHHRRSDRRPDDRDNRSPRDAGGRAHEVSRSRLHEYQRGERPQSNPAAPNEGEVRFDPHALRRALTPDLVATAYAKQEMRVVLANDAPQRTGRRDDRNRRPARGVETVVTVLVVSLLLVSRNPIENTVSARSSSPRYSGGGVANPCGSMGTCNGTS
ncbi:PREDICTED: uncharacterized protein LOC106813531 [Priapulus caudatus]|uniref:Uncharacterized protein LOC106813531 n=1 Tax=Priapulus caudatus TaxID=37621 RepID=A0ABM1ELV5_PRICU|nr:PREDICTED: uncharacterized protein LOC106813531 [Priapulus caudatus]